jgi:hypothetical protein
MMLLMLPPVRGQFNHYFTTLQFRRKHIS